LDAPQPSIQSLTHGAAFPTRFSWFLLSPLNRQMRGFNDNPALDFEASSRVDLVGVMTPAGEAFFEALERL